MACSDLFAGTGQPTCSSVSKNVNGPAASDAYLCNLTRNLSWDSIFFLVSPGEDWMSEYIGLSMVGGLVHPQVGLGKLSSHFLRWMFVAVFLKAKSRKLSAFTDIAFDTHLPLLVLISYRQIVISSHSSWLRWGLTNETQSSSPSVSP